MKTFRPFVIAVACYAAAVAVCWTGWAWFVTPEGAYARTLLGLGGFGVIALGARTVRKRGVWPSAMLAAIWMSGLGALVVLFPDPQQTSGELHATYFTRAALASGATALLWAGLLSIPRLERWRQWMRRLTVYCVFLQATWPVALLLAHLADRYNMMGLDALGIILFSSTFCYLPSGALAIAGTVTVIVLAITQQKVRAE